MNRNVIIVLAGGFLIAILVAVMVQTSLNGSEKPVPVESAKAQILVAAKDLAIGREVAEGDVKWQDWPESNLFAGAVVRKDGEEATDAVSGRLLQNVSAGQPVHMSMLIKGDKGNFLAASLKKGMRAVGIPVKTHTIAGGFIGPGDYVDVIVTHKVSIRERDNPQVQTMVNAHASETILENIRVVAVDQEATKDEEKAKIARTVTLEVDADGAEKLSLAAEMGDITLSLRGIGDKATGVERDMTTDVKMSRVLGNLAIVQGGGAAGNVKIYNGGKMEEVQVRQNIGEPEKDSKQTNTSVRTQTDDMQAPDLLEENESATRGESNEQ